MFHWRETIEPTTTSYGVQWLFTDRHGGVSRAPHEQLNLALHVGDDPEAVHVNRQRVAEHLGLGKNALRFMDQQHGAQVAHLEELSETDRHAPAVDGLITGRADEALVVMVADCVPVLIADLQHGLVAAVHAGRPGLMSGIIPAALRGLRAAGAGRLQAVIGPSICARCYEVPLEMREQAAAMLPVTAALSWTGTPAIDVAAGVVHQLVEEQVAVNWLPGCAREHPGLFSYRRDGRTGRFAGVVRLLPRLQER